MGRLMLSAVAFLVVGCSSAAGTSSAPLVEADAGDADAGTVAPPVHDAGCTLVAYHRDADGDGYGNPVAESLCVKPADAVDDATDCDDTDANVHPKQAAYFTTARADSTYDYDCSGHDEPQFKLISCSWNGAACDGADGFYGSYVGSALMGVSPACGLPGLFATCAKEQIYAGNACNIGQASDLPTQTQACH